MSKETVNNEKVIYPIVVKDYCIAKGLLPCNKCRDYNHCHRFLPKVFPDFNHECSANFLLEGVYYHYKIQEKYEAV